MKSVCSICRGYTNQKVLFEKSTDVGDEDWWESNKYQVIQCEGCDKVSYRTLHNDIQQNQHADYEDPWTQEVYPKRSIDSLPIKILLNTPNNVRRIYRETIDAFNNDQYILCTAGLRAIIEGICNEKSITKGEVVNTAGVKKMSKGLDGKIEGLCTSGFLTKTNAETLHELRFIGNEAVHELASPSDEELKLAIGIIEHTIENIYELQHKAKKLKSEKAKRKNG
jgi:hypothetical protein